MKNFSIKCYAFQLPNKLREIEKLQEGKTITEILADEAGLVDGGKDEEGDQQWIGTNQQWNRFEKLKEHYEETQFDEKFLMNK